MSLAVIRDLAKYTPANEAGEIQFSKLGLLATTPSISTTFKVSGFLAAYALAGIPGNFRLRFTCPKFVYELNFTDQNFTTTDNFAQTPSAAVHNGQFAFNGSTIDVDALMATLQASIIGKYYTIDYSILDAAGAYDFIFKLTAKDASADYNMVMDCFYSGMYQNGASIWLNTTVNYAAPSLADYKLHFRILVEEDNQLDTFREVYSTFHTTGQIEGGRTIFTFREVPFTLRQYLSLKPILNPFRILTDSEAIKKFKVEYWESWTTGTTAKRSMTIDTKYALAAGVEEKATHLTKQPITSINNITADFLIAPGQPAWFSWLLSEELLMNVEEISFIVTTNLGTHTAGNSNYFVHHSRIYHVPVHLGQDTAEGVEWIECTARLWSSTQPEIEVKRRYTIDNKYYPIDKWYYYLNSLGGIDTIRLYGESEDSLVSSYSDYETIRSSGSIHSSGFESRFSAEYKARTKAMSGWIDRDKLSQFTDFISTRSAYEIDKTILPTASAVGEFIPSTFSYLFHSIRHTLHAMQSHRVLVKSSEVSTPKTTDNVLAYKLDLERTYTNVGVLESSRYTELPELFEDELEFTVEYNHINKGGMTFTLDGDYGNIEVYMNGYKIAHTPISSLPYQKEYGTGKSLYYIAQTRDTSTHIRIRGSYIRKMKISWLSSVNDGKMYFNKHRFLELRDFEFNTIQTLDTYRADKFYLASWRTLSALRIFKLSEADAVALMLAINDHYNFNAFSAAPPYFTSLNLQGTIVGSGLVPGPGNNLAAIITSLNNKGITVTL